MLKKVDVIVVMTQNGGFVGWSELYKGFLVEDQETNQAFVYMLERCNSINRYYKIQLSDLMVGETNDTLYIQVEKDNWSETSNRTKQFSDKRIESVECEKEQAKYPTLWQNLLMLAKR